MKHGNNISTSHQNIVLNPTNIQHNHIIVSASEAISPTYEENEGLVERGEGALSTLGAGEEDGDG